MMKMRLHDEHWYKNWRSQILCGDVSNPWVLKPSHTIKAFSYSNHVKLHCIQENFEEISTFPPFTSQHATLVHDIGDGHVGRHSMTLQGSLDKYSIDGNEEWWKWYFMMNIIANLYDLKYYVGTSRILDFWNPPIFWR